VRKKKLKDVIIVVIQSHLKRDLDFQFLAIDVNARHAEKTFND
jgi:hypothetical protein